MLTGNVTFVKRTGGAWYLALEGMEAQNEFALAIGIHCEHDNELSWSQSRIGYDLRDNDEGWSEALDALGG